MARKRFPKLPCPTCKKPAQRENPDFPFCSERCRLIDLGKWASGGYVISTPITDPEMLESMADESRKRSPDEDADSTRKH